MTKLQKKTIRSETYLEEELERGERSWMLETFKNLFKMGKGI